ncbi:hypothetical protein KP509_38G020800 [Ceratopteris richardii]|nr:hypothetical protein KP509_38G020800 [Ceratopteris richardii]
MAMTLAREYDSDDEDEQSGWGSHTSSEYRLREKPTALQEQRRAMQAVVDGHFRALVGQLLDSEGLDGDEFKKDSWLEIVASVASQAASFLKPDSLQDGSMDPGTYVKVKCIASGQRTDSCVVKGVVCKKNLTHRLMPSQIKSPRLLLLGGSLEYQRVSNQFSSLDTLLQQEKDHLSMMALRIQSHHPQVVLVERNVSRHAQEQLFEKKISLVINVKKPLLERIARCTGAEIVPCPDQIMKAKLGHCDIFHVERFVEDVGSFGKTGKLPTKTLMFFDGCPRLLGCTVLLRGAKIDELKKVKRVVQFAVFAAYQLALETSFLVDEGATLPDLSLKSPISVTLPDKSSKPDRSISMVPGFLLPGPASTVSAKPQQQVRSLNSFANNEAQPPVSTQNSSGIIRNQMGSTAAISSVTSSLFSTRNNSPNVSPRAADTHDFSTMMFDNLQVENDAPRSILNTSEGDTADKRFSTNSYETVCNMNNGLQNSTIMYVHDTKASDASLGRLDLEASEASNLASQVVCAETEGNVQSGSLWEDQMASRDEFPPSPSDNQSILVSFSSVCLRKGRVCERGHLFRIKYYGSFDKPLGKFLKDNVFDLSNVCGLCEETRDAHLHCYMHRQGSLTISVHRQKQQLPGKEDDKIWMWHRCLKCPRVNNVPPATPRVLMSDAAWGLSFGKFLELSFSNHAAASRVAACGHPLHRDCLRFYGFGSMAACFRYAPINVHSVYLPPSKLEFNHPDLDEWLRDEIGEITDKGKLIFAKHFNSLREIDEKAASTGTSKTPEARRRVAEYEASLIRNQKEFFETLHKATPMRKDASSRFADILELNSIRRGLSYLSLAWNEVLWCWQASIKSHKTVITSKSANLDETSILLGIKDKKTLEAEEACTNTAADAAEVQRPRVTDGNVQTKKGPVNIEDTCQDFMINMIESQKSIITDASISAHDLHSGLLVEVQQTCRNNSVMDVTEMKQNVRYPSDDCVFATSSSFHNLQIDNKNDVRQEATAIRLNELIADGMGSSHNEKSEVQGTEENFDLFIKLEPDSKKVSTSKVSCDQSNKLTDLQMSKSVIKNSSDLEKKEPISTNGLLIKGSIMKGQLGKKISRFYSSMLEQDSLLLRRSLSEGQFPVLADLTDTFGVSWTGKGQVVEAHEVHISSNGQEISAQSSVIESASTIDEPVAALFSETSCEPGGDPVSILATSGSSSCEEAGSGSIEVISTPSLPLRSEKSEDLGWIGTSFSDLYRTYNKSSHHFFNESSIYDPHGLYSSNDTVLPFGEGRIFLPLGIQGTVIPVYDDEPTSIIAYAITSHQYQSHLSDGTDSAKSSNVEKEGNIKCDAKDKELELSTTDSVSFHPLQTTDGSSERIEVTLRDKIVLADGSANLNLRESSNSHYSKATHVKVSFTDNEPHRKTKFMVTCYYAKQFDALRKTCCADQMDFIRSLCRCKKWGAQGGKSNVFFAKTRDDRFVIKQVTKTELESFIKFAPAYFKYLSESLKSGSPTCLAKILGVFQVTIRHGKGGKELRMDLMAMENLLYGRHVTRLYDLKGSLRSRYNADTTGKNKVLLDENLLESMLTNPIFIGNKAKRILERAVWNDTSFLASVDVMDYSLLVGIDEEHCELVLGIIDFMRQYTWDKHLETWVKASGILGGPKNAQPTVISPKQYKKRFRKAMKDYFLMVPDQWSPAAEVFGLPHVDSVESFQSVP